MLDQVVNQRRQIILAGSVVDTPFDNAMSRRLPSSRLRSCRHAALDPCEACQSGRSCGRTLARREPTMQHAVIDAVESDELAEFVSHELLAIPC